MTGQELINAALREIGKVPGAGASASSDELADGLVILNQLLDSLSAQALPIPQITRETFALTGAGAYTIGVGQAFNTTRPLKIKAATVLTAANLARAPDIITAEQWSTWTDRSATGHFADVLYYDGGYPTGTIFLAPKPTAGGTLELYLYKALTLVASLATNIALPQGYDRALRLLLAGELAPQFGREIGQTLAANIADAKTSIYGLNAAVLGHPAPQAQAPEGAAA